MFFFERTVFLCCSVSSRHHVVDLHEDLVEKHLANILPDELHVVGVHLRDVSIAHQKKKKSITAPHRHSGYKRRWG